MVRAEPNQGWERRRALIDPSLFKLHIVLDPVLLDEENGLDDIELERLERKLSLVAAYAAKLCAGMLKGTIKYATDDRTPEEWLAEEEDEDLDRTNYRLLKQDAIDRIRHQYQ